MPTIGRLISPPAGVLRAPEVEFLSGPRAIGAGGTQSTEGFVQTTAAAFGLWRFRFLFSPLKGTAARRYRGWIAALHGGANATRWQFRDRDMMSFQEAGISATNYEIATGVPWSNGQPWSNGRNWKISPPVVSVAAAASLDATVIMLADEWWGHRLGMGDMVGFFPFHFGMYEVTDVIDDGVYRVWPPLRKTITTDSKATLNPTLALRLEGEDAATGRRGITAAVGLSATFIETLDYDIRDYFAG